MPKKKKKKGGPRSWDPYPPVDCGFLPGGVHAHTRIFLVFLLVCNVRVLFICFAGESSALGGVCSGNGRPFPSAGVNEKENKAPCMHHRGTPKMNDNVRAGDPTGKSTGRTVGPTTHTNKRPAGRVCGVKLRSSSLLLSTSVSSFRRGCRPCCDTSVTFRGATRTHLVYTVFFGSRLPAVGSSTSSSVLRIHRFVGPTGLVR